MFEIVGERTTFGRLCALLARIPGIEFADLKIPARYTGPTRFRQTEPRDARRDRA